MLLEAYDEWVQTASSYWGCSITLSSRTLRGRLTKLSPWPGNIKSELKPFYYLQTLYPSVVNIQFANHSSVGASIVPDWPHMRGYRAGAFIPPEKHNERLWDFLVQEIMNASKGENYCHIIRLGGM